MYVCNCNGLTESEVESAIRSGVSQWDDVHEFYGCQPCCGQCECEIKDTITGVQNERATDVAEHASSPELAMAG